MMTPNLWFEFDGESFGVAMQALQSGCPTDTLEAAIAGAVEAQEDAALLAGAAACAVAWCRSSTRLWMSWEGGAVALSLDADALVMVMNENGCSATLCPADSVAAALDSVDFELLPGDGQALATVDGRDVAAWIWRDGAVLRGLPGIGVRTLAEPPRSEVVSVIAADLRGLLLAEATS